MYKKIYEKTINFIKKEYKHIILLIILYLVLSWPLNYYIVVGGGTSNIDSRVKINNSYKSKGSLNICYVTELRGNVFTYLLSYIIPDWKRVNMGDYKYNENENYKDLQFRSNMELENANNNSVRIAYNLANKYYKVEKTKIYVTGILPKYKTKLKIKDQILSIDNNTYKNVLDYKKYIQSKNNDYVIVKVLRNNKEKYIKCKIHKYKSYKILGITLEQIDKYKTDPKIKIKFRNSESGPSGGLITTLDIYNKLTKKDITHSYKIAGTGTIDEEGNIGSIGEVKYKLLGAVKDKIDIFLVPSGNNYKTCKRIKKERKLKIKLIEVKNIEEAIKKLNKISS